PPRPPPPHAPERPQLLAAPRIGLLPAARLVAPDGGAGAVHLLERRHAHRVLGRGAEPRAGLGAERGLRLAGPGLSGHRRPAQGGPARSGGLAPVRLRGAGPVGGLKHVDRFPATSCFSRGSSPRKDALSLVRPGALSEQEIRTWTRRTSRS